MAERTIKLTGDLEAFVDAQVESGAYATAEDVVRAGLEALKKSRKTKGDGLTAWERENLDDLKRKIDEGIADEKSGRLYRYELGELAADVIRRGRERFQKRQKANEAKRSS